MSERIAPELGQSLADHMKSAQNIPADLEAWSKTPFKTQQEQIDAQGNPAYRDTLRPAYRLACEQKIAISADVVSINKNVGGGRQDFKFDAL